MEIGKSAAALLRRGVDLELAAKLTGNGQTLARLKAKSATELKALGLADDAIKQIRSSSRPPIPPETLYKLLNDNAYTCCVCRDRGKPIIVHHIIDWAKSKSHAPENLAVLCLDHHNKAHSKMGLSQNLTMEGLRRAKKAWEAEVATFAATALLDVSRLRGDAWQYFNHQRLWEIAIDLRVPFLRLPEAALARQRRLIDKDGNIVPRSQTFSYMYGDGDGIILYQYVKAVMEAVLSKLKIINISDHLERTGLPPLLAIGDILFVQGAHDLKLDSKIKKGRGQAVHGVRRVNHVRVEFVIDRWEATSTSAWVWLAGRHSLGSIMQLKTVDRGGETLILRGTVLGLLNGTQNLKTRGYEGSMGFTRYDYDEDEENEHFDWKDEL